MKCQLGLPLSFDKCPRTSTEKKILVFHGDGKFDFHLTSKIEKTFYFGNIKAKLLFPPEFFSDFIRNQWRKNLIINYIKLIASYK